MTIAMAALSWGTARAQSPAPSGSQSPPAGQSQSPPAAEPQSPEAAEPQSPQAAEPQSPAAAAQQTPPPPAEPPGEPRHPALRLLLGDVKAYYTAPLRWDAEDWALFGGALGAIAIAHSYDRDVRSHFAEGSGLGGSTSDLQDAVPAVALWLGTYLYASEYEDKNGLTASWAMLEAAGLATATDYALKYAVAREGPNQTTDPNRWFASGSSFPSEHASLAFAIGTVFAESGSGGYRWITGFIGYGVASFTAYERLKHNAHWLSDVVAGAALGTSTGFFVADRTYGNSLSASGLSVAPAEGGGLMLAYRRTLP